MGRRALNAAVATLATISLMFCLFVLSIWYGSQGADSVAVYEVYPPGAARGWPSEMLGGFLQITQRLWKHDIVVVWVPRPLVLGFAVLLAIAPMLYWPRRIVCWMIRRHRRRRGLCLKCGYDIRESRERCPECGELAERERDRDGVGAAALD